MTYPTEHEKVSERGSEPSTSARADASAESASHLQHMAAGATAGIVEHVAMFPLDTIKTRMQAQPHELAACVPPHEAGAAITGGAAIGHDINYKNVSRAVRTVLGREGVRGLYRGVDAMALGAGPAHAFYFATYEVAKELFGGNAGGHQPGACATVVADAIFTPLDTVKQRLQIANSPYRGLSDCFVRTLREEGWWAFYRSYPTTLLMNVPFTGVQFAVYESAKLALVASNVLSSPDEEGLLEQLVAGGAAGGLAAAVTNPLDIAKTRLQTAGVWEPLRAANQGGGSEFKQAPHMRVGSLLREMVEKDGYAALSRGIGPRVLFHVPAAAVCWATYETMKKALGMPADAQGHH